jgi:C4-dicarboxylate transporter, DctQ subunit
VLRRIQSLFSYLEELTLWVLLLQMVVLCFSQVVMRYAFRSGFPWAEELLRFEVVFIAFLGAGLCMKHGTHIGMDFVYHLSPPGVQKILGLLGHTFIAAMCFFLFYLSIGMILKLSSSGFITPALGIPKYIPYIPLCFGSFIIAARAGIQLWASLSPLRSK